MTSTYAITRPIMGRAELAQHQVTSYGRDYTESCDGYEDMEAEEGRGWHALAGWGRDGWDLGNWPYVVIYVRNVKTCGTCGANLTDGSGDGVNGHWANCTSNAGRFELMQIVEGDRDVYRFATQDDRNAAIDYLFLWYAAGEDWAPLTWEDRERLDAGGFTVDEKYRGPYRA